MKGFTVYSLFLSYDAAVFMSYNVAWQQVCNIVFSRVVCSLYA